MDSNLPVLGQMLNTRPYISGVSCCYQRIQIKHMPLARLYPLLSVSSGDVYWSQLLVIKGG